MIRRRPRPARPAGSGRAAPATLRALAGAVGLAVGIALATPAPAVAASLQSCSEEPTLSAAQQAVLLRTSLALQAELERHGSPVAIVARSGLALSWFGMRYSHAGLALRHSPETPWAVRQLYFACDEGRPRLFDQGLTGFLMGTHEPELGYLSVLLLPPEAAGRLEALALDNRRALALLDGRYSANAHVFSLAYQNCNQWVAELIAAAWGLGPEAVTALAAEPTPPPGDADAADGADAAATARPTELRRRAQHWLREAGYRGSLFELPARPFTWLTAFSPWLNRDDHPADDLAAARFEVSMPLSIERFVLAQLPQAQRLELCHTRTQVVIRRGGAPIADGCVAAEGDEVIALD